jgi:hypothetical protein
MSDGDLGTALTYFVLRGIFPAFSDDRITLPTSRQRKGESIFVFMYLIVSSPWAGCFEFVWVDWGGICAAGESGCLCGVPTRSGAARIRKNKTTSSAAGVILISKSSWLSPKYTTPNFNGQGSFGFILRRIGMRSAVVGVKIAITLN